MVLFSFGRMLLRRMALRKGVALSAAGLFLLGVCGVIYMLQEEGAAGGGRTRTIVVPTLPSREQRDRGNKTLPLYINTTAQAPPIITGQKASHSEGDSETFPVQSESSSRPPSTIHVLPNTSEECLFSATQPAVAVDVHMVEVFDSLSFENTDGGVWKQGFELSYSRETLEPLQVFLVPHSHNDPGWLRTFEDYYRRQTRNILNLMTDTLTENPHRKFIWAEISYLDLWWQEQNAGRRQQFRRLVEGGQLEIVTGGWVMNDEASTHYFAMLDQLLEGHLWMQENLPGVVPKAGWAIDPFGYTPTMAFLLRGMGLDAMLIQRVHYSFKKYLAQNKQLEFGWRQLWDQGSSTDILCHVMPFYSYDIPHTCGPDPKVCCQFDFKRLAGNKVSCPWKIRPVAITDGNVASRAEILADQYRKKAQLFRSPVLLVPLGDDFRYDTKKEVDAQFSNYEKLIGYMNSHPEMKIKVQFGTLSDYFSAVRQKAGPGEGPVPTGYPSLSGNFYTYSDRDDHFWSGYFTSRPFYKNLNRVLETNLRAAEILFSLARARGLELHQDLPDQLKHARQNLGLFQHHDGITGTAKDPVVVDYANRITEAITRSQKVMTFSVQALLSGGQQDKLYYDLEQTHPSSDALPRRAVVGVTSASQTVVLYNSLPQLRVQLVSLRVDTPNVMVRDHLNSTVASQVCPVFDDSGTLSRQEFELVFTASVPALGLAHYHLLPGNEGTIMATLQFINQGPPRSDVFKTEKYSSSDFVLRSSQLEVKFSGSNGLLHSVVAGTREVELEVDFVAYGTRAGKEKSGAYLFLPDGEAKSVLGRSWGNPPVVITVGPLLQEVRSTLNLVTHTVRLLTSPGLDGHALSITNTVDIRKESNKELAMRLRTSIANPDGVFYTDLNGLQLARRRTVDKLPLQGNFYPMATSAMLQDSSTRLSLLSQQPLGVASLKQGWLEVVLDRRLMQDDFRGMGQGVKDNKVTMETFKLLIERRFSNANPTAALVYPSLMAHHSLDELLHPMQALIAHPHTPTQQLAPSPSLLHTPFPCDLHLVNLRSLGSQPSPSQGALILHRRAFDCAFNIAPLQCELSAGKVQLAKLFPRVALSEAVLTSLTLMEEREALAQDTGLTTHLEPMDIHTYRLEW